MKLSKTAFYVLSFTWGIVHTSLGMLAAFILILLGHKPKKYGGCLHFELPRMTGGVSLGPMFITYPSPSRHICDHEHGHAIQNCLWGPLFPFVIAMPSFLRCQWRRMRQKRCPELRQKPYDSIWFEGQATRWGASCRIENTCNR